MNPMPQKRKFITAMLLMTAVALPVQAVTTTELDKRLQRLEKMAENPIYLQLMRRIETQEKEVQRLQDRMDRLAYELEKLKKQSDKRYAENDERISQLASQLKQLQSQQEEGGSASVPEVALPMAPSTSLTQKPTPSTDSETQPKDLPAEPVAPKPATQDKAIQPKAISTHFPTSEEKEAYKSAFALVKTGKYAEAIKAFKAFQKQYPASKLAANAAYWQGEVGLLQKQNQQALEAFDRVLMLYPKSLKVPDAMLRKADALVLLGQTEEAKNLYQMIAKKYPDSRAAKSVGKRLKILADAVEEKDGKSAINKASDAPSKAGQ